MVDLKRPPTPILVFDIETVPDLVLLQKVYNKDQDTCSTEHWNSVEAWKILQEKHNLSFPVPLFHGVVSICGVFLDPETFCITDGFKKSLPPASSYEDFLNKEKHLIGEFWNFCNKYQARGQTWYDKTQTQFRLSEYQAKQLKPIPLTFCGYNICQFDLPVLEQRSIKHRISCPIADYGQEWGYTSYRSRYALDKVLDLFQYVTHHNPSARMGLQSWALALGLGGKLEGMDGQSVMETYFVRGENALIEDYCAVDVLITYGLFLAIQRFRGLITGSHYQECVREFKAFLLKEGKPLAYAQLFHRSPEFFVLD